MDQRIEAALKFGGWALVTGFADDLDAAKQLQRQALAAGYPTAVVTPFEDVSGDIHWTVKVKLA